MKEACALTGQEEDLIDSHIIPAFIFKYIKTSNGNQPFYWVECTDREVKDGWKKKMLSPKIDNGLFGKWERWTKNHIYDFVWAERELDIDTKGDYFFNFVLSLFWRVLFQGTNHYTKKLDDKTTEYLRCKLDKWRDYLNPENKCDSIEERLFFMPISMYKINDRLTTAEEKEWIRDSIGYGFYNEESNLAFYCKCPKCLFWCVLQGDFSNTCLGTEIHISGDLLKYKDYILRDDRMQKFIQSHVRISIEKRNTALEKSKDKFKETIVKLLDDSKFTQSEGGQIILSRIYNEYRNEK